MFPFIENIPTLTTSQMIEVDRAMIEDFHIELIQMMENAGRNLAHLARHRFLAGDPRGSRITVLAGVGGNGGGALVCARHLHNHGAIVHVYTTKPADQFTRIPKHQLDILHRMQVPNLPAETIGVSTPPDLIIDGLIGYSLKGAPRGSVADLIRWANTQSAPTLALDVPSGLDTTSGTVFDPAIRAAGTLTLALPKAGFFFPGVEGNLGELYLADISVPPMLYRRMGIDIGSIFAQSPIVRIR
ncbi:MAG: NAD(P)H-hydrate epimerase [Anaerolineae bacterium]|nr:NAD(P)H-hydrate epimerase [Anaerolineae bacterium]